MTYVCKISGSRFWNWTEEDGITEIKRKCHINLAVGGGCLALMNMGLYFVLHFVLDNLGHLKVEFKPDPISNLFN